MDAVAHAVADPVRRQILTMLRGAAMPAGAIAAAFEISRPAVSRHLRVLRESGLAHDEAAGRERIYRLDPTPLRELDAWLADFRPVWDTVFDALDTEVRRARRDRVRETQAAPTTTRSTA
jgi:DNA-binding transcriptional ArsR family regulator